MVKSNRRSLEEMSFMAGTPILLKSSEKPRFQIGGFAISLSDNLITLSYENPLDRPSINSRKALTRGDRTYKIKEYFQVIVEFESAIKNPETEAELKNRNLIGRLNVSLGDFIAMGYNDSLRVSGFVLGIDTNSVFLSHQDPFFGDDKYLGSSYSGPRQAITIGKRTYYLNNFNIFEILSSPAKNNSKETL